MIWYTILAAGAAWIPAKYLTQIWKRGPLALIAAVIGVISSFVCTFAVVFAIDFVSPVTNAGQLVLDLLSVCSLSVFISPFAAWWGWRSAKKPRKTVLNPPKTPNAFDDFKPK